MSTNDIPSVKPSDVTGIITAALTHRVPVMLWGPPGVGKSALVRAVANAEGIGFIDLRLVQIDQVDLRGLPYKIEDADGVRMGFAPSNMLPREGRGILFLDELPQAPTLVQNAASELLLDRTCGEYKLPDGWIIVAAGNRRGDRAGTIEVPSHLKNRVSHFNVEVNVEEWVSWAKSAGLHEGVVKFIESNPRRLHQFNADSTAYPTCRTWEFVARGLASIADKRQRKLFAAGCIGLGAAGELMAFLQDADDMPTYEQVIKEPTKAPVPETDSGASTVTEMIAEKVTKADIAPVVAYLKRLKPELAMLAAYSILARDESFLKDETFLAYAKELGIA